MSDDVEQLPPAPRVVVIPPADDGDDAIVLMHMGDKVRTFFANSAARMRKLVVSVAVAEFGLAGWHAERVADDALAKVNDNLEAMPDSTPIPPPPNAPEPENVDG
jgi:hypothetical protein